MENTHPPFAIRRTEMFCMKSEHVGDDFQIYVQLPRSYAGSEQTYPTLYLTDGDDLFPLVTGILHALYLDRAAPDMLVVGIGYGADSEEPGNRRLFDMGATRASFPKVPGTEGEPRQAGGGGENFLRFIRDELIPHIEKTYRTDPANRAYAGLSFGGLFGAYILFNHPNIFQRYILCSPSLWWDDCISFKYEAQYAETHTDLPARVFLTTGSKEKIEGWEAFVEQDPNVDKFAEKLAARPYPSLAFRFNVEEGDHAYSQPSALTKGLRFIFDKE